MLWVHSLAVTDSGRRAAARTLTLTWVVLVLAALALGWLITGPLSSVVEPPDDRLVRWLASRRTPGLNTAAAAGSHVADTIVGVGLALVVALVAARARRSWRPVV